jgi:hypothetical protein
LVEAVGDEAVEVSSWVDRKFNFFDADGADFEADV